MFSILDSVFTFLDILLSVVLVLRTLLMAAICLPLLLLPSFRSLVGILSVLCVAMAVFDAIVPLIS